LKIQTHHKLREAEARFAATFEQAAVGIAHVAPDGAWLRINNRFSSIIGYSVPELLGKTFQDITHPDDLKADLEQVRRMLSAEIDHYSMEKRYFHKLGHVVWVNLTVALVWHSTGYPDYFISVVEDISRRKHAEEEVALLSKALIEVQESERQFLALELHDEIGQQLTALKIALSLAQKQDNLTAAHCFTLEAMNMTTELIGTVRRLAHQLRPPQLDDFGLIAALSSMIDQIEDTVDVKFELLEDIGSQRFAPTLELACFRIIQEAISNSLRHAQANLISISLTSDSTEIQITIDDDGNGFDLASIGLAASLGLSGMRKRATQLGGKLTIRTSQCNGTSIQVNFRVIHD
jgi:two-component system, NarL family, sensor histidine kinase UhpB